MSTHANPGDTPSADTRPTSGRFHEHAGPYLHKASWLIICLLAAAQAVDAIMGKTVWDILAGDAEWISWTIAIGLTVIAALAAFLAGRELGRGHQRRYEVSRAGWLALGLIMAALRIAEPFLTRMPFNWGDVAMATAILGLYLLAGMGIIFTSSEMHNPKLMQLASAGRESRRIARKLHPAEGRLTRVHDALAAMADHRQALETEYEAALAELRALEDDLKARARLEIAVALRRPEATGVYRQETWPATAGSPAA